jgi:hypothetical protein
MHVGTGKCMHTDATKKIHGTIWRVAKPKQNTPFLFSTVLNGFLKRRPAHLDSRKWNRMPSNEHKLCA